MAAWDVMIQPPAKVQCGGHLNPPFLVELSNTGDDSRGSYMAYITLHTIGNQDASLSLQGSRSVSGFPKPDSKDSYLFAFPEMQISAEGKFRLRADIYKLEDGAKLVGDVFSRDIKVDANTVPLAITTSEEQEKMEMARQAGALK